LGLKPVYLFSWRILSVQGLFIPTKNSLGYAAFFKSVHTQLLKITRNRFDQNDSVKLVVSATVFGMPTSTYVDSVYVHRYFIAKPLVATPVNPDSANFPDSLFLQLEDTSLVVNYVYFRKSPSDSSNLIIPSSSKIPCSYGSYNYKIRLNPDSLYGISKKPTDGSYRAVIIASSHGASVNSDANGIHNGWYFKWPVPQVSGFFNGAGTNDSSGITGIKWFESLPSTASAIITGPTLYGGLPIKVSLKTGNGYNQIRIIPAESSSVSIPRQLVLGINPFQGKQEFILKAELIGYGSTGVYTTETIKIGVDNQLPPAFSLAPAFGNRPCSLSTQKIIVSFGNPPPDFTVRAPLRNYICSVYTVHKNGSPDSFVGRYLRTPDVSRLPDTIALQLPQNKPIDWDSAVINQSVYPDEAYQLKVTLANILQNNITANPDTFQVDTAKPLNPAYSFSKEAYVSATGTSLEPQVRADSFLIHFKMDSVLDATQLRFQYHKQNDWDTINRFSAFENKGKSIKYLPTDVNASDITTLQCRIIDSAGHQITSSPSSQFRLDFIPPTLAACSLSSSPDTCHVSWTGTLSTDNLTPSESIQVVLKAYQYTPQDTLTASDTLLFNYTGSSTHIAVHLPGIGNDSIPGNIYNVFIIALDKTGNNAVQGWKIHSNNSVEGIAVENRFDFSNWKITGYQIRPTDKPFNVRLRLSYQANALGLDTGRTLSIAGDEVSWKVSSGAGSIVRIDAPTKAIDSIRFNSQSNQPYLKLKGLHLDRVSLDILRTDSVKTSFQVGSKHYVYTGVGFTGAKGAPDRSYPGAGAPFWSYTSNLWGLDSTRDSLSPNGILLSGKIKDNYGTGFLDSTGNQGISFKRLRLLNDGTTIAGENTAPFYIKPDSTVYYVTHASLDSSTHRLFIDSASVHFYRRVVPDSSEWGGRGRYQLRSGNFEYGADKSFNSSNTNWWSQIIYPNGDTSILHGVNTSSSFPFPVKLGMGECLGGDTISFTAGTGNLVFHSPFHSAFLTATKRLSGLDIKVTSYGVKENIPLGSVKFPIGKWGFANIEVDSAVKRMGDSGKIVLYPPVNRIRPANPYSRVVAYI
jgi:hypothetical protein